MTSRRKRHNNNSYIGEKSDNHAEPGVAGQSPADGGEESALAELKN